MRALVLLMLVAATTFDFITSGDKTGWGAVLPGKVGFANEIFAACALLYVLLAGVRSRFRLVRPAYWIVFGLLAMTVICGVVANGTSPGSTFAGLRNYLRALPWFFVPAVAVFSDRDLRTQLALLLLLCLLQLPIAVFQRIGSMHLGMFGSGDYTTGTMQISSILSIFLISAACVLTALRLHRRIGLLRFLVLFVLLLIPTTINETKGSLMLLPIGLGLTYFISARPGQRLKTAVLASSLLVVFTVVFVPAYDYFQQTRGTPKPIGEFFTEKGRLQEYLWKDEGLGTTENAGRVDSITVPLQYIARDPTSLFFGLGIGNASRSALGEGFQGRYAALFEPFITTAFARIVLELGLLGLIFVMCLHWLIFVDAVRVSKKHAGLTGTLAAGWIGVTAVMTVSIFYKDIVAHAPLSFVFWYLSGLIAAERMRLMTQEQAPAETAALVGYARPQRHAIPWVST